MNPDLPPLYAPGFEQTGGSAPSAPLLDASSDLSVPSEASLSFGLSWDFNPGKVVDVDIQAVLVNDEGVIIDAAYYNNLKASGRSVTHSGDEIDGKTEGIDEKVTCHLSLLNRNHPTTRAIFIVVACYSGGTFADVREGKLVMMDDLQRRPLANYVLTSTTADRTCNILCCLYRKTPRSNQWALRTLDRLTSGSHFMDAIADLQLAIRQVMPDAPAASRPVHFQMSKGHVMDFGNDLSTITCGLGWDTDLGNIDLDVSCVMYDMNGSFLESVFFGNLQSCGAHSEPGAVVHSGDNLTGEGEGDDEQIVVFLNKVGPTVAQVFFCLNIYTQGRTFGNVANPYVRVVDSNQRELCVYRPREVPSVNGLLVCRLARDPRTRRWGFHALGVPSMGSMYKDCLPEMNKLFFTKTNALLSRMPTQPLDGPAPSQAPTPTVVIMQNGAGPGYPPQQHQQPYASQHTFHSQHTYHSQGQEKKKCVIM